MSREWIVRIIKILRICRPLVSKTFQSEIDAIVDYLEEYELAML